MTAAQINQSPFARAHGELSALGYHPVPIVAANALHHRGRGKAPGRYQSGGWQGLPSWQSLRTAPLSGFPLSLALKAPDANVGLVMGTPAGAAPDGTPLFVMSIDVDTEEPEAFDEIVRAIPASPMRAKGKKGWKAFYRAPEGVRSRGYDDSRVPRGAGLPRRLVDVLTGFDTRQAVVSPSVHPDGGEYCWLDGPVRADELPIFSEADHERLVETLQMHGYDPNEGRRTERKPYVPSNHVDGDAFDVVKAAALANLSAWVPALDLYGLRPARGGYECVNTLRDSSSGQPLERRKRNLSIQGSGIKDFGSGDTWSAIDFVADFCGLSVPDALRWLEDRLGLGDDGSVVLNLAQPAAPSEPVVEPDATEAASTTVAPQEVGTELPEHLTRVPGLVGQISDWITATARKPQPALSLAMALGIVGTVAGRKFCGPTQSATHLYMLCTAPTGSGKNAPKKAGAQILAAAGMRHLIGPSSFTSASSLIQHVSRSPASLCIMDEFAMLIGKINAKSGSSHEKAISGELRQFWSLSFEEYIPPRWASSRERQQLEPIVSPALSLIGLTTADELYTVLQGGDVVSGFLNRFLLVATLSNPADIEPEADVFSPPEPMVEALQAIASVGGPLAHATMHSLMPDRPLVRVPWEGGPGGRAHQVFKALVAQVAEMKEHEALTQRCAEMAVRLATVRAIGIGGADAVVTVDDMLWGSDFALWSTRRLIADVEAHMVESEHQARAKFVLRIINEAPGGFITRTALCRRVNHRFDARALESVLDGLREAGQIRLKKSDRQGAGKKAEGYFAA